MQCTMLKAKLHRGCVTHAEPDYEGSCAIDEALLNAAGILEYEQIHIYNLSNGERLVTYAIRAQRASGIISVNGAAALKAQPGDRVIICAYGALDAHEMPKHKPNLVYLDETNVIIRQASSIPLQAV